MKNSMNEAFWEKYPKTANIRCIEMKDRAQERITRETRGLDYDQLFAYFREASNRFWRDLGHVYTEASPTPMAVKEPSPLPVISASSTSIPQIQ